MSSRSSRLSQLSRRFNRPVFDEDRDTSFSDDRDDRRVSKPSSSKWMLVYGILAALLSCGLFIALASVAIVYTKRVDVSLEDNNIAGSKDNWKIVRNLNYVVFAVMLAYGTMAFLGWLYAVSSGRKPSRNMKFSIDSFE